MASFRFELNSNPTKNKTYSILLCITTEGKRKRLKTSIEVKRKSDFNSKAKQDNWIRTSEPHSKVWNEALSKELEKAKQTYRGLRDDGLATSERVANELMANERTSSFLEYAKTKTQEIYDTGGIRNWKKYNGFLNKLQEFMKKQKKTDITFSDLTPSFLSKFELFLHTLRNERQPEKKLHPNTIQVVLNIFKTLVRKAVETDKLLNPEKNPFLSFSYKGVKTEKEKLDASEIKLLEELSLPEGSLISNTKNCFLFSYYCAGIRAGDLIQLRWSNISIDGERLHYQMGKNHKERDLKLVGKAKTILAYYHKEDAKPNDYIFPLLDSSASYAKAITQANKDTLPSEMKEKLFNQISSKNALLNKELKKIAKLVGIGKNISFHISRHSFAKIAKDKGIDNSEVQEIMAHSSLKITEGYMGNFDTKRTDKTLANVFEEENPKDKLMALLEKMKPEEIEGLLKQINTNPL